MVKKVEIRKYENIVNVDTEDNQDDLDIRRIERVITITEVGTSQTIKEEFIFEQTE